MQDLKLPQLPEFTLSFKMKEKPSELIRINTSEDVSRVARLCFDADSIDWVESFVVIALNRCNKVLGFYKVSQGGVSGTYVDNKVILQFALLANASSLIVAHNHPSGNLKPSSGDETVTQKLKQACVSLDIKLLDHIIVSSEGHYSFADEGLLY